MATRSGFSKDSDVLYWNVMQHLVKDAKVCLASETEWGSWLERCDLKAHRSLPYPSGFNTTPYTVKWMAQLNGFLKRYTYRNDLYSPQVLAEQSLKKFDDLQLTLPSCRPDSIGLTRVLGFARTWIRETLGDYSVEEHEDLCNFGSRAAKFVNRKNGLLDRRLKTISGSVQHRAFFERVLSRDSLLKKVVSKSIYETVSCLDLICVPKSYKAYRTIMPDSVLGGFYSSGLGKVLMDRLRLNREIDLKRLQPKHQAAAKLTSRTRHLVTADLSSASDSFTLWLVRALLPSRWWRVLRSGRVPYYSSEKGKEKYLTSFMAMGIGFTFPLQTILFQGLLEGIQRATNLKGKISVFGDDLLYPTGMHKYVEHYFALCGFQLNRDKTFVTSCFRESCGGDFYHGVDVRPFSPEGSCMSMGRTAYLAELHKLHNGLLEKWDEVELSHTLFYLQSEIHETLGGFIFVEDHYPSYSGLKRMEHMRNNSLVVEVGSELTVLLPQKDDRLIGVLKSERLCEDQYPFYWQTLSGVKPDGFLVEFKKDRNVTDALVLLHELELKIEKWLGRKFLPKPSLTFLKRLRKKRAGKVLIRKKGVYVTESTQRPRYTFTVKEAVVRFSAS